MRLRTRWIGGSGLSFFSLLLLLHGLPSAIDDSATWRSWLGDMGVPEYLYFAGAVSGVFIASSGWWWSFVTLRSGRDTPAESSSALTAEAQVVEPFSLNRTYTLRTLEEILAEYNNRTDMQAERVLQQYIGKWFKVDGEIKDISELSDYILVFLGEPLKITADLRFEKKRWRESLETMTIGDRLASEGKIREVRRRTISLEDCEITQATRPTAD